MVKKNWSCINMFIVKYLFVVFVLDCIVRCIAIFIWFVIVTEIMYSLRRCTSLCVSECLCGY